MKFMERDVLVGWMGGNTSEVYFNYIIDSIDMVLRKVRENSYFQMEANIEGLGRMENSMELG